ncbi:cell division protein FtsQ [Stackebrandtia albiflava]|uniref:Cell division protein FtsQ n=1 Tax=Stackebrandtia albiflava TaxID=406432 RepID=A0A562VBP2_9ACTN|nr:FtsQ-type POTRA domain-containing protein [Stackebrandtia albiflava]TWJ15278.1 cell division protein FtsQ [Stackebrandtia albiflava]
MARPGTRKSRTRSPRTWRLLTARVRGGRRWLVFTVLGVVVLAGFVTWLGYGSPAFGVERVEVRGATFTDPDKVREAAAVPRGTSLLAVDADGIAARVAELAEVARVEVGRDWPHTVVVEITERTPRLAVPTGDGYALVDAAGVVFRTVEDAPSGTVVATLDDPGRADPATVAVLTVLSALTPELESLLVKVSAPAATRITLLLEDERTVFWGDASDSDRKAQVATALLSRPERHFDVSAPDVPTVS